MLCAAECTSQVNGHAARHYGAGAQPQGIMGSITCHELITDHGQIKPLLVKILTTQLTLMTCFGVLY